MQKIILYIKNLTPFVVALALLLALGLHIYHLEDQSKSVLFFVLLIFSIPLWIDIISKIFSRQFGVDFIAGLALVVAIIYGQYIAGAIILLMLSGGEALELYAIARARKALSNLLSLMPTVAHIKTDSGIRDIESKDIVVGALIIVKSGEVIPVDGVVSSGFSFVDESIMTGESLPVKKTVGNAVFAGTTNYDRQLEITTSKPISESRLEGIIKIVRRAEEERAPFVRMADKYSVYFTIFTLILSGLAWFISGDPIRLLAVLVVATPCPLILATPIAFLSGMSAASKRGIIVKNGGALEALSQVSTFVFDKTGTITLGIPKVHSLHSENEISENDLVTIAASLDQLSVHPFASSLVGYAQGAKGLSLFYPEQFFETFGEGVEGVINKEAYLFGKIGFLEKKGIIISEEILASYKKEREQGIIPVYLGSKGKILGVINFQDEIRADASNLFVKLHNAGKETVLLTGDKEVTARSVAESLSISSYKANCAPEDKVKEVTNLEEGGKYVAMVGDGVNDAPALAAARVGIALGSHGATAASDTADMVIMSSSINLIYDAWKISVHAVSVARQGILIGIGLSSVAMVVALLGFLPPVSGALLQEVIDVAVILYALRAGQVEKILQK